MVKHDETTLVTGAAAAAELPKQLKFLAGTRGLVLRQRLQMTGLLCFPSCAGGPPAFDAKARPKRRALAPSMV